MNELSGVAGVFADFGAPWWIAGGWALDLFLGAQTREHDDVDVAVLRRDQLALFQLLEGGDPRYVAADHEVVPWDGRPLEPPVHEVHTRAFEVLLNEHRGDRWVYRRDPSITCPLGALGGVWDGIPFLRPEVVLLYKSKDPSPKDEADFDVVLPRLDAAARSWLDDALRR
jgi:hypothetical protein